MMLHFSGGQEPEPAAVILETCSDQVCEVTRNVPAKMELTIKPTTEATKLEGSIHARIAGIWIPWITGSESKVCKNLIKGKCPISANSEATYSLSLNIPFIAPVGTKTNVKVRITDQNNNVVACTHFPVIVVA